MIDTQTFTANGTWTKPDGAVAVEVHVFGGGGGGGQGSKATSGNPGQAGGGGGAGGHSYRAFTASDLRALEPVIVGKGGIGLTSGPSRWGQGMRGRSGRMSKFSAGATCVMARGGVGGLGGGPGTLTTSLGGGGGGGDGDLRPGGDGGSAWNSTAWTQSTDLVDGEPGAAPGGGGGGGTLSTTQAPLNGDGAPGALSEDGTTAGGTGGNSGTSGVVNAGGDGTNTIATLDIGSGGGGGSCQNGTTTSGDGGDGGYPAGGGGGAGGCRNSGTTDSGDPGNGADGVVVVISWDEAVPAPDYADVVLADRPVIYWPLTDTSGSTAVDASGHGHDGTYNGSPALATRTLNSVLGDVADFDGSNDYVSIAAGATGTLTAATVEAWLVLDVLNNRSGIVTEAYTGGGDVIALETAISADSARNQKLSIGRYTGAAWAIADAGWNVSTATLYHVVGVHDGQALRLYLNGEPICSVNATMVTDDNGWLAGICHGLDNPHDGALGHVAIYDYALSAERVRAHYRAGVGAAHDGKVRYLDTFNRPVMGPLGPNEAAYELAGTWIISSNSYVSSSATAGGSLVADFGTPDVDVSADMRHNPGGNASGVTVRWVDSNNFVRAVMDSGNVYLGKRVGGTYTNWASVACSTVGRTIRVVVEGNDYTVFVAGRQVLTYTDTDATFATATKHGLNTNLAAVTMDNLEVAVAA